ncbi:hypothetical protein [Kribbella sp. NPDC055071]
MAPEPRRTPKTGELAAIRQVMDFFAIEAVLALDRYERSFSAGNREQPQQSARRLARWWTELMMDEVDFGPDPTDAQRILAAAGSLATGSQQESGLRMQDAVDEARLRARVDDRVSLTTEIEQLRGDFESLHDGNVRVPEDNDRWLKESLTRLANASVLADVLAVPAQVTMSKRVRDTANELVGRGQELIAKQQRLHAAQAVPIPNLGDAAGRQAALNALFMMSNYGVNAANLPYLLEAAAKAPAAAYVFYESWRLWSERKFARHELDSARTALRGVRPGLTSTLDTVGPLRPVDVRAINRARSPRSGPER